MKARQDRMERLSNLWLYPIYQNVTLLLNMLYFTIFMLSAFNYYSLVHTETDIALVKYVCLLSWLLPWSRFLNFFLLFINFSLSWGYFRMPELVLIILKIACAEVPMYTMLSIGDMHQCGTQHYVPPDDHYIYAVNIV